jgi:RNA polymerase sigma-70 factor, ECF subfamily
MLGNEQDAHDIAQDSLVKILKNLHRYDINRKFSTWAFGITRNTCIDLLRRRKRRSFEPPGDVPDMAPGPLTNVARSQRAQRLMQALDQLAPLYREVLVLYHFEHLKYREIADTLEVPLGTVMNRIFRARRQLRTVYEEAGGTA